MKIELDGVEYLTPGTVAKMFRVHPVSLKRWRAQGKGPKYIKFSRGIFYRADDVTVQLAKFKLQR